MEASGHLTPSAPTFLAVIVLYGRTVEKSESFCTLISAFAADRELAENFSVIVHDNSPDPQSPGSQSLDAAPACRLEYVHDGQNGGLAPAYNYALAAARREGAGWLLLLDQDTSLSLDYLRELDGLARSLAGRDDVGAIVPKLVANGVIYSPEANFLYQMRHQFRKVRHPIEPDAVGVQPIRISAYNSGAAIRVSALAAVGGFPAEYWLDYLDHAVFHALSRHGYALCVMQASLEQRLSHMDVNDVPHWRHRNVLTAQTRFVVSNGTFLERTLYRLYLLRTCRFLRRRCRNRAVWKEMLLQALLLRVPSPRLEE
jgi:GT2 family glycosyltransferase